jgi:hypothetical protein
MAFDQELPNLVPFKRARSFAIGAVVAVIAGFGVAKPCNAQLCVQLGGQSYKQSFNTLAVSGTSNNSSSIPIGFAFSEAGTGNNITFAAGDGSSSTNNTYSFGTGTNTDRAFGELGGALQSTVGACFVNNSGLPITSLSVSYTGEQWRLGVADATIDRLDFQFSTNATALNDNVANWIDVNSLDFASPNAVGPAGALDGNAAANRTAKGPIAIIPSSSIPFGATFFMRWLPLDIAGNEDGLAIDDFSISYGPTSDFNLDTFVDGADLLRLLQGYGTKSGASISTGDANKDGAVDAIDFAIWRSQFDPPPFAGSGAGNGVPEPAVALLVILAAYVAAFAKPRSARFHRVALLFATACLVMPSSDATAQNVSLSLNIFPNSNANPDGGGSWVLVAKTTHANGIAAVNALISGINTAGITYGPGINAALDHGAPYVAAGTSPVNVVYFQDFAESNVVVGVGTAAFSSDLDPLGDVAFDNATKIISGTYNTLRPAFAPKNGQTTDALVLSTSAPPFQNAIDANTMLNTRIAISGDYNLNGKLDAADYVLWRNNLGSASSLRNDNTLGVAQDDYTRWRSNFGSPAGSGSATAAAVPETSSLALIIIGIGVIYSKRRYA